MFTATLFTVAKTWKPPNVNQKMNRGCGVYKQCNTTQS